MTSDDDDDKGRGKADLKAYTLKFLLDSSRRSIIAVFLVLNFAFELHAEDANIIVIGRRREQKSERSTGQSLTIKPSDASRFDSSTHLRRESSLLSPETGRISASGFVVPKIRGQDVKLTEVYLEDVLLQDPYSGLPLVEDLDLRAFGSMEIHQGLSPFALPGVNPIGAIRYRFLQKEPSQIKFGQILGRPFGSASWTLANYQSENEKTRTRIYARTHESDGRYAFYSDEATPYNSSDDQIKIRDNNDQRSKQILPFFHHSFDDYTLEGFAWFYDANRGLPSQSVVATGSAREEASGHLIYAKIYRDFSLFLPAQLSLGVTHNVDQRSLKDSNREILVVARDSNLKVQSKKANLKFSMGDAEKKLSLNHEASATTLHRELEEQAADELQRSAAVSSFALYVSPLEWWQLEGKLQLRNHQDRSENTQQGAINLPASQVRNAQTFGASTAFCAEHGGIYFQTAVAKRLPSLIEEFGNGSTIQPNPSLEDESIQHREIGAFTTIIPDLRLGAAAYFDTVSDKIVFVPASINSSKAANIRKTEVLGNDVRVEASYARTGLLLSFSRLYPYDKTTGENKLLPGIPEQVFVAEIEQGIRSFTIRWLSRYRSRVYRDTGNTIELPGAWIHDASLDYKTTMWTKDDLKLGASIRNVFNLMSVPISTSSAHSEEGRTSYSEVSGSPLPGRQWLLWAETNWPY